MSDSMEISLADGSLFDRLTNKGINIPSKLSESKSSLVFKVQNNVMDAAPYITNNLMAATIIEELSEFSARVFPDEGVAPYALFIILGTDPYIIEGNPWLFWPGAAHPVRKVHHPGIKADNYFERGFTNSQSDIEATKQELIDWLTNLDG